MSSFNPARDDAAVFEARALPSAEGFEPALLPRDASAPARETQPVTEPEPDDERQRAWQDGFAAARAEHAQEAAARLDPALRALAQSADSLDRQRRRYLAAHREAVVELALLVAERIVGEELGVRPERVAGWVRDAAAQLERVEDGTPLRIFLAPDDLEPVRACDLELAGPVEWLADPRLARGEARVESGASAVRVGLEAGVREMRHSLRGALGQGGEGE